MRDDGYERYRRSKYYSMVVLVVVLHTPTARKEKGRDEREEREVSKRVQGRVERSGAGWRGVEWSGEGRKHGGGGGRRRAKESQAHPGTR